MATPQNYDVVIVGAGMAGCILAAKLAESGVNPRNGEPLRIALLEAGPRIGGAARPGYGDPDRRRVFTDMRGQDEGSLGLVWPWGAGRLVGGSAFHWQAIAGIPRADDLAAWRVETGVDWTPEEVDIASTEVRERLFVAPAPEQAIYDGQRRFRDVARGMGREVYQFEHARKNCFYCGYCGQHQFCRYDSRSNSALHYLPTAEQHGVEVIPDAEVERLVIEKRGARPVVRGVVYSQNGQGKAILAERIVVSCGSFGTPVLLMRSGYGRREDVADLVAENPNVGQNVDAHPSGRMVAALFDGPIKEHGFGSVPGFYFFDDVDDSAENRLIIAEGAGEMTYPDQTAFSEFAPDFGRDHKRFMKTVDSRLGATYAYVAKAKGVRGRIDPKGGIHYPGGHPTIQNRLDVGEALGREILEKMGAARISDPSQPGDQGQAAMEGGTGHEVAACRAGSDAGSSVVNSNFESHDVDHLLVCDASSIPRVASIGCGATVATIAILAAKRMISHHFRRA